MAGDDLDQRIMAAIERLARNRRVAVQRLATQHDLSPLQAELLALLCAPPPPDPAATALARELGVSQATVSDAVAALVRKGLVTDDVDPSDRRRKQISATTQGRALGAVLVSELELLVLPLSGLDEPPRAAALRVLLTLVEGQFRSGVVSVDRSCLTCAHHRPDGAAGYCELLRTPLTFSSLQVDCADHVAAA